MSVTALFLFAFLALSSAATLRGNEPRIVNGEDAQPGERPFQISLQTQLDSRHFCGGSILNKNYVITAAHCVANKPSSSIKVVAGTINLREGGSVHQIEQVIVHEEYDPSNSWLNDIALLKVKTPFVMSEHVSPVPMPKYGDVVDTNAVAVTSGWGRLWLNGPTTHKLQRVNNYIASQDKCRDAYARVYYDVYETHICANDPSVSKGACNGDSGGPLTVDGTLVGLTSWSIGCASTRFPTVYTRVSKYTKWIEQHTL
ncbi:hypothetical protein KM043_016217 [Ampulex compressa]|nr:hypothetical protein KM043_016217 [Ampulex compressa]